MVRYFRAKIKGGKFESNWENFKRVVSHLFDGDYLLLLINVDGKDVRESQSKYFAILGEWSLQTGFTKAELHDLVKSELFPRLFEFTSTTDLGPEEWAIVFFNLQNFLILKFENK